ncbi:MAG TPA: hypothetical protein VKE98_01525 [Gemmataceae bacterium]|nr:hypothetical protein [Gemmataceae bacterium]
MNTVVVVLGICTPVLSAFADDTHQRAFVSNADGLGQLRGDWVPVKSSQFGPLRVIFEDKTVTLVFSKTFEKKYTFAVDSQPRPAHINVHHGEAKALGIFERVGDMLRICMGPWQGERPTEFKEKGKNVILLTLMRERKCALRDALLATGIPSDDPALILALQFVNQSSLPANLNPKLTKQRSEGSYAYTCVQQKSEPPQPAELEAKLLKALADRNRSRIARVAADILCLSDEQRRSLKFRVRPGAVEFRFVGRCPGHEDVEFLLSNQNRAYESLLVLEKAELTRAEKVWKAAKLARATLPPFLQLKLLWMDKDKIRCEDLQDAFRKTDPNQRTKQYFSRLSWEDDGLRIPNIPLDPAAVPHTDQTAQILIILRPAFLD